MAFPGETFSINSQDVDTNSKWVVFVEKIFKKKLLTLSSVTFGLSLIAGVIVIAIKWNAKSIAELATKHDGGINNLRYLNRLQDYYCGLTLFSVCYYTYEYIVIYNSIIY